MVFVTIRFLRFILRVFATGGGCYLGLALWSTHLSSRTLLRNDTAPPKAQRAIFPSSVSSVSSKSYTMPF